MEMNNSWMAYVLACLLVMIFASTIQGQSVPAPSPFLPSPSPAPAPISTPVSSPAPSPASVPSIAPTPASGFPVLATQASAPAPSVPSPTPVIFAPASQPSPSSSNAPTPSPSPSPSPNIVSAPSPLVPTDFSPSSLIPSLKKGVLVSVWQKGLSGEQKAGIAFGVILVAAAAGVVAFVLVKRRENIRRAQYGMNRGREQL